MLKKISRRFIGFLIMACMASAANGQQLSHLIMPADFMSYNYYSLQALGDSVYTAVMRGDIVAYKDPKLKQVWDPEKLNEAQKAGERTQINIDPNDPYITTDTVFYIFPTLKFVSNIRVLSGSKKSVVRFNPSGSTGEEAAFYISFENVSNSLSASQKAVFQNIVKYIRAGSFDIASLELHHISDTTLRYFKNKIHEMANRPTTTLYNTDSFKPVVSILERKNLFNIREKHSYQLDPNNRYNTVDSVICHTYSADDQGGITFMDSCINEKDGLRLSTIMLGPYINAKASIRYSKTNTLYYLNWQDFTLQISPDELLYLNDVMNFIRLRKLAPEKYELPSYEFPGK